MGLRRLWQMLTIDAPWAISNWLWATVVTPALAGVRQLTLRRIVYIAAFLVIACAAAQLLSADLAVMFAGDTALYIEIVGFAYFAIARGRVGQAVKPAARMLGTTLRRGMHSIARVTARAKRPLRRPRLFDRDNSDVPGGAFAFA